MMFKVRQIAGMLVMATITSSAYATNYYVNDNATTNDVYTVAIGNDATGTGTTGAPFATLAKALSVATAGDDIYVDVGNYAIASALNINKAVRFHGPNDLISAATGTRVAEAVLNFTTESSATHISLSAPGAVTFSGFELQDNATIATGNRTTLNPASAQPHIIQNNRFVRNGTANSGGTALAISTGASSAILVDNNRFTGTGTNITNNRSWYRGIWVTGGNGAIHITNNNFNNCRTHMGVDTDPNVDISGNTFSLGTNGNTAISFGALPATTMVIANNTFSMNSIFGFYLGLLFNVTNTNNPGLLIDATSNIFNGTTFANASTVTLFVIEAAIIHGNNTGNGSGFVKLKPNNVFVVPSSNGSTAKTVQATITKFAVPTDTVNIGNGTYNENLTINKALTLLGQSQTATILRPGTSNPNCNGTTPGTGSLCSGGSTPASNVVLVQASDVTVQQLTIDGNNTGITSGVNAGGVDIDARNGIITDHSLGTPFDNLKVNLVTIRNIYLRGMYASSGGSFTFSNNTVSNVQGDASSIAIFNFGGAGTFSGNNVTTANDAISSNWSQGSIYTGNTITNSGSGIHTDNNGGAGGVADLIEDNTISNSPADGYGIFVFAPYLAPSINSNTITNVTTGLANFGQNASAIPTFSNNVVNAQNKPNSIGVYQTTDQVGFGSNNVSGIYTNNVIANNETGFLVDAQAAYTNAISANNNAITGNTTGVALTTSGTLVNDFSCNWWGTATSNPAVAAAIGATVNYLPYLNSGTDNDVVTNGFQPAPGTCIINPLPINLVSFTGSRQANGNVLRWETAGTDLPFTFGLQRSYDGQTFEMISTITPSAASVGNQTYSYTDKEASAAHAAYYRVKIAFANGRNNVSNIVKLEAASTMSSIVKPIPFTQSISITPSAMFAEDVSVSLYTVTGTLVRSLTIAKTGMSGEWTLDHLDDLPAGAYTLILENKHHVREVRAIFK